MTIRFKVLLLCVSSFLAARVFAADPESCDIHGNPVAEGFNVKFYEYTFEDTTDFASVSYMATGYQNQKITNTTSGVTDVNFDFKTTNGVLEGELYGQEIYLSNFSMELTGYFKAPETGTYTVSLTNTDDTAMVFVGNGFECCNQSSATESDFLIFSRTHAKQTIDLQEGKFYPMRLVYVNIRSAGILDLQIKTPSGTEIEDDWSDYIYQLSTGDTCIAMTTTTTMFWTGSELSTISIYSGSTEIIEVKTPLSTFTTPWTGTTTYTTTVLNPNGSGSLVEVNTPIPRTTAPWTGSGTTTIIIHSGSSETIEIETPLSTTTVPWTGSGTTTYTIPNPNGSGSLVEVETPLSTTAIPWTGSDTTTITISNPMGSGSLVEIETPRSTTTTVSTWSESYITVSTLTSNSTPYVVTLVPSSIQSLTPESSVPTYTTASTWSESYTSVLTFTSESTPWVETLIPPPPSSSVPPISAWAGTDTSVFILSSDGTPSAGMLVTPSTIRTTVPWTGTTTSVTTFTSNGTPVVEHFTPASPTTVEKTSPWTGTISLVTTFTSKGIPYIEYLTPYSTITTPWTGTNTVTTLIPNPDGTGSIYQVKIPTESLSPVTVTVYEPCDEGAATIYTTTCGPTVSVIVQNPTITATSTAGCETVTIYKPCRKCEANTSTISAGGSVAVVIENPTITAASTVAAGSSSSGSETSQSNPCTLSSSSPAAKVYEGEANSLVSWPSFITGPVLLLMFVL